MNKTKSSRNRSSFIIAALLVIFAGLAASLFLSLSGIFAQNQISSQSIEISPPSQEVLGDPGETVQITSKVRNKSQTTIPVQVRIEDFTATGEEGQVALEAKGPYSLATWSTLSDSSFTLAPGEERKVIAHVKIPAEKVAGGYYGSFVYRVVNPEKGGMATIGQEIASLFLLKVTGLVNEKLFLDEFTSPVFSEFGPIPFSLKFTNTGNIHTKAFGLVNVTDMFGQKVADIVVPGTNIFPGASRVIRTTLDKQFLFGKYTATAIIYFGSVKNETLTAVSTFTVIPLRIIAVIAVAGILLYLLRKRIRKAMKALFS